MDELLDGVPVACSLAKGIPIPRGTLQKGKRRL